MPRDPKRLNQLYLLLPLIHRQYPDLRFGQLVSNLMHEYAKGQDIFQVEDEGFILFLWNKVKQQPAKVTVKKRGP